MEYFAPIGCLIRFLKINTIFYDKLSFQHEETKAERQHSQRATALV